MELCHLGADEWVTRASSSLVQTDTYREYELQVFLVIY